MNQKDLRNRFEYHPPKNDIQIKKYESIRKTAKVFAEFLVEKCPDSKELSLAITNLEQAVMWANAAIARNE